MFGFALFLAATNDSVAMSPTQFVWLGIAVIAATAFALFKIFNEIWKPFEHRLAAERVTTLSAAKEEARNLLAAHAVDPAAHILTLDERYPTRRDLAAALESIGKDLQSIKASVVTLTDIVVETRDKLIINKSPEART